MHIKINLSMFLDRNMNFTIETVNTKRILMESVNTEQIQTEQLKYF